MLGALIVPQKEAWYSHQSAIFFGTVYWRGVDGRKVELTGVDSANTYGWKDKVFLGYVDGYLCRGREGIFPDLDNDFQPEWDESEYYEEELH